MLRNLPGSLEVMGVLFLEEFEGLAGRRCK